MRTSWLLAIVTVAACSDDSVTLKDYIARRPSANCPFLVACGLAPDLATCKASTFSTIGTQLQTLYAEVGKTVKYDGVEAAKCLAEIGSYNSCVIAAAPVNDPCAHVFTGTVADGGACFTSGQCANEGVCTPSASNCDPNIECCTGTCHGRVAIGHDCSNNAPCVAGAYCDSTTTCAKTPSTAGAACSVRSGCAGDLVCATQGTSQTGTCLAFAAHGATCDPNVGCDDFRDYCDQATRLCTTRAATGMPCRVAPGFAECVGDNFCNDQSKCAPYPTLGQSCSGAAVFCLLELECGNTNTCQAPTPDIACP